MWILLVSGNSFQECHHGVILRKTVAVIALMVIRFRDVLKVSLPVLFFLLKDYSVISSTILYSGVPAENKIDVLLMGNF